MGDLKKVYQSMRESKKVQNQKNWDKNMDFLAKLQVEGKIKYTSTNVFTVLLFREHKRIHADFYPSTNRWKYRGNKIRHGDAKEFYKWYLSKDKKGETK